MSLILGSLLPTKSSINLIDKTIFYVHRDVIYYLDQVIDVSGESQKEFHIPTLMIFL